MKNLVKATALAFGLILAVLAGPSMAQNTGSTTTTQPTPATQSTSSQTTRETTTTTQTKPTQTTRTETTTSSVDPMWLILGGVGLLAILLIVILSMRGRSRSKGDTVYESKTVIKKD
jgi:beta-lactamase regulating signal transducer with metallopeptidase domain